MLIYKYVFSHRAKFDIFHKRFLEGPSKSALSQVYLSCHFCNKSIMPLQINNHRRLYSGGGYGPRNSVTVKVWHERDSDC